MIKARLLARYPAAVEATAPIVADFSNGTLDLSYDSSTLATTGSVSGTAKVLLRDGAVYQEVLATAVSYPTLADQRLLGNVSGGTAAASALTGAQANGVLPAFTGDSGSGGVKGLVPAPAAGDAAAGRFLSAGGTFAAPTFTQSGTGANSRLVTAKAGDFVNVLDFIPVNLHAGIKAGSSSTDVGPYFNNALNYLITVGGKLYVPSGRYYVTTPILVNLTGQAAATSLTDFTHPSIEGDGSGSTIFYYAGANSTSCLRIIGTPWTALAGSYSRQTFSGFTIQGTNPATVAQSGTGQTGIDLYQAIWVNFRDVSVNSMTFGIYMTDIVGAGFHDCQFVFNNYGIRGVDSGQLGVGIGSPPNELTFVNCAVSNNRMYGAHFTKSANVTFIGGAMEANGLAGAWVSEANRWCIRITNAGYNGAYGLALYGVHFETNRVQAEVWIDHDAYDCLYDITGCDFVQNGTTNYSTTVVQIDTTGATRCLVNVKSGFRSVSGYVPDASRRRIQYVTVTGGKHRCNYEGSLFADAVETPLLTTETTVSTVTYTTVDSDDSLVVTYAAGTCTLTLPSAGAYPMREIAVRTTVAQTTVSASSNVVPRTGTAAGTAILAASAGAWAILKSNGTNWIVKAGS